MVVEFDKKSVVAFLDIGASKIACLIGAVDVSGKQVPLGFGEVETQGFANGRVSDIEKLFFAIKKAVGIAETSSKCSVVDVVVSLSGIQFESKFLKSSLKFTFEKTITLKDIEQCSKRIDVRKEVDLDLDKDSIVHIIPIQYLIDDKKDVKNPVGLVASSLEIRYHIIVVETIVMNDILLAVKNNNLQIKDVVVASYASGIACLTDDDKRVGSLFLDIGKSSICGGIFFNDNLIYNFLLPLGGDYITNQITQRTNIKFEEAEKLKIKYGAVAPIPRDFSEYISILEIGDNGEDAESSMPKSYILDIIYPYTKTSFSFVKKFLDDKNLSNFINRVIITGGGSKIQNVKIVANEIFLLPVRLAVPIKIDNISDEYYIPEYSTLLGLFLFYFNKSSNAWQYNQSMNISKNKGIFAKVKKFINDNF